MTPPKPTRRDVLLSAGGLLLLGATGCGAVSSQPDQAEGAKRTINHKHGRTEISGTPQRVVTVGLTEQDPVLALGVKPVGIGDWYGDYPHGVWPWAQDELGAAKPATLPTQELDFERIATLAPDLITGVSSGMTKEDYQKLSEIAPTVAQSGDYVNYGTPWEVQTRTLGRALNKQAAAEKRIAEVQNAFARARKQHPEFQGASGLVAGVSTGGGAYIPFLYNEEDVRSRFLTGLGFTVPPEITKLAGDSFYAEISRERLDLIDRDVVVWVSLADGSFKAVQRDSLYRKLAVAREDRSVFLNDEVLNGALSFGTVLSLPFVLEKLLPRLATAVDGTAAAGG